MKDLEWMQFLTILSLLSLVQTEPHPPRIDLGLILEASSDMKPDNFLKAKKMLITLLDNFSISPGATRVSLYTISNEKKRIFHFKTHVNRRGVLKAIRKLEYANSEKSYSFQSGLFDIFKKFEAKSRDVLDQRKIYLFITNEMNKTSDLFSNMRQNINIKMAVNDVVAVVSIQTKYNLQNEDKYNKTKHMNDIKSMEEENSKNYRDNAQTRKKQNDIKLLIYQDQKDIPPILIKLGIPLNSYTTCEVPGTTRDECNRECTCKNGRLTDCFRIRQEFTAMTAEERRRYLKAYKTLTSTSPYKTIYEPFIFMHYKYFCWGIHKQEYFLPWHRWFISVMEDLLKQIDCRVTVPYWDWSHMSENPWDRKSLWRPTDDGLGGNGNMYKGYCVQNGIFRESQWQVPYWEDPMDIILSTVDHLDGKISKQRGHLAFCLRRGFKGHSPSRKSVRRTLALPASRFKDFDIQMRHNYHDRIHNIIGGTMCTHYAGDTPEFFLHHAFLDKIWYMWQAKSPKHKFVHFLQRNTTKMMGCPHTQKDMIDSHELPRYIKVKYTKFPEKEEDKRDVDSIDDMARTPYKYWNNYMNESWYGNFPDCDRSKKEKKRAKYLHKVLDAP